MTDSRKTKAQLIEELSDLRQQNMLLREALPKQQALEHNLRKEHHVLQAVFNETSHAIFVKDLDGRMIVVNDAFVDFLGRPREEIIGSTVPDLFPPETASRLQSDDRRVLESQASQTVEPIPTEGEDRTYLTARAIYHDRMGRPAGIIGIARDITERKRAEETLRESEERFRGIFQHSNDAILLIDPAKDEILDANPVAQEMLDYTRDELLSLGISDIHPDEMPLFQAFARTIIKHGHGWTDELTCLTKYGERVPSEISASVVEVNGQTSMIALVRDITERKRAEAALRASEQRFRNLVEQAADAFFVIGEHGQFIDVNKRACESLGYTRDELLDMSIFGISIHSELENIDAIWDQLEPDTPAMSEGVHRRKDGKTFPVEVRVGLIELEEDDRCLFALARDITERKEAEKRIRREAARADALARVAARLNTKLELDAVLKAVCEETANALDVSAVSVLLCNEGGSVLMLAATWGLPSSYRAEYVPTPRSFYESFAEQQGPLIVVPDLQAVRDLPNAELYARHDIHSVAATSMIRDNQLIGTLNVYTVGVHRTFSADERVLLTGLADQVAQAIENARLYEQAQQLAVMAERNRLARELHDSVTHGLYGVTMYAEASARLLNKGHSELAVEHLQEIRGTAQEALQEMRLLIFELRPPVLERAGLVVALQTRLEAVEERAGIEAKFSVEGDVALPAEIEAGLYRIAQEALNNALKHSQLDRVRLHLQLSEPAIALEIEDNGIGFDVAAAKVGGGMGLRNMTERAAEMGGDLTIDSRPGEGTHVKVEVHR
ncbi:MAG: Signal transduction histidine-protein kinase/phosphatase DegS [Anaerolineales bacterium]|nr:Signal transduction histidine-protein kinase/phosphatase DegS [Anaerolineales bacterium]